MAVALAGPLGIGATRTAAGPKLAHMVYFKLKDGSGGNRAKLIASCKLLLSGHDGVEYFSTGSLAADFKKEFNDRDFDVSLNLVFADKDAHDKYQESERHKKFIEENLESIEKGARLRLVSLSDARCETELWTYRSRSRARESRFALNAIREGRRAPPSPGSSLDRDPCPSSRDVPALVAGFCFGFEQVELF